MDRTAILNDVSFTIQGGQKVGISGRSGRYVFAVLSGTG